MAAIAFAVLTYDAATPFPSLWAMAPVLGTVAIIVAASPATLVGKVLGTAPFVGIGLISYSAYLWHQPLFAFARLLDPDHHPQQGIMLLLAGAALILAWLSWRFVERPFRRRDAFTRKRLFALSGIASSTLSAIAAVVILSGGLPQRYPEQQRTWVTTGPLEYGDYVRGAYRAVKDAPLSDERPNMVLVGDSFSQDFYNVILAAGAFNDHSLSGIYIPARCQVHFGIPKETFMAHNDPSDWSMCKTRVLSASDVAKMRAADVVIFAARWKPWAAAVFDRSLEAMALSGEVIVVGSKSFEKNRRALLAHVPADSAAARKAPTSRVRESTELLEETVPKEQLVNLVARMCVDGCPLFTNDGELISYDGKHLTPAGAAYLSKFVFDEAPLAPFAGRRTEPARRAADTLSAPLATAQTHHRSREH